MASGTQDKGTWYYIFRTKFNCKIMQSEIGTIEERRRRGRLTTGDKERDRIMHSQDVHVMLTINEMVEYFERGTTVKIAFEDTKTIYRYIQNHLHYWANEVNAIMKLESGPPADDMILLDEFANAIYDDAKYFFTNDFMATESGRRMLGSLGATASSMLSRRGSIAEQLNINTSLPEGPSETRRSLAEIFEDNSNGFRFKGS